VTIDAILVLLGLAAIVAAVGDELARQTSRRAGFAAAGGFLLIVAAPIVPNYPITLGFSLDDALPLLGLVILVPLVPWGRVRDIRWGPMPGPAIALTGVAILVVAGLISAVLVGGTPGDVIRLAIRGTGRIAFLAAITATVAILGQSPRAHRLSALAIVAVGTFEAVFGVVAYVIGLPFHAGLEIPRDSSVLAGSIPGRVSGTLGISPNFTAAIFMMSILVTAGLALATRERRERALLLAALAVQGVALVLTYTRVSLALTVVALAILIVFRSRPILLLPLGLFFAAVAAFTPTLERLLSDANDRLALWTSAYRLMIDHPISGVGAGQTLVAVAANPERYRMTPFGTAWSTAHNTILLAGAEMGILGAVGAIVLNVGLAVLALVVLVRAARQPHGAVATAAALGLLAFLAQGMANNLIAVGVTGVFAAFLVGTLVLEARGVEVPVMVGEGEEARPRRWVDLLARWRRPAKEARVALDEDRGGV
jgi:O-antigen ligase